MKSKNIILLFIILIQTTEALAIVRKTVLLYNPGSLTTALTEEEKLSISSLILSGHINAKDFKTIRDEMPNLTEIDFSTSVIESYIGNEGTGTKMNYRKNTIPENAFSECYNITAVSISPTVDSIDYCAFNDCPNLIEFNIPENSSLRGISDYAFEYCEKIKNIHLPASLKVIGNEAFYKCYTLEKIEIPESVIKIGNAAFSLTGAYFIVDEDNNYYSSFDGILYDKSKTTLIQCSTTKTGEFSILETVKTIGTSAFCGCQYLTSVIFPPNLSTIKSEAFEGCNKLESIILPYTVKSIGWMAFKNCTNVKKIQVHATVPIEMDYWRPSFEGIDKKKCTLFVPKSTKTLYEHKVEWEDFEIIKEFDLPSTSTTFLELFEESGNSSSFTIFSDTTWTVDCSLDWLTFNRRFGIDTTLVEVVATPFSSIDSASRIGTIMISSAFAPPIKIEVKQHAQLVNHLQIKSSNNLQIEYNNIEDVIMIKGFDGVAHVQIYALNGTLLLEQTLDGENTISTNQIPEGTYLIRVKTLHSTKRSTLFKYI